MDRWWPVVNWIQRSKLPRSLNQTKIETMSSNKIYVNVGPAEIKTIHNDVIIWKHFSRYWPLARGIHRSPVNSRHKVQWREALKFPLICSRAKVCVNNRSANDLRRHRAHYDGTEVMCIYVWTLRNLALANSGYSANHFDGYDLLWFSKANMMYMWFTQLIHTHRKLGDLVYTSQCTEYIWCYCSIYQPYVSCSCAVATRCHRPGLTSHIHGGWIPIRLQCIQNAWTHFLRRWWYCLLFQCIINNYHKWPRATKNNILRKD